MQTNKNFWQLLPLSKIASASSNSFVDGPFGSNLKSDEYTTEGVRLIQLQNIGDGEWIDDNKIFTSEKKHQELKRHAAFPGDIAIAKMADPIARACIIPPVSDRFLVVADCIKLTPDLKKYHPKFIVYAINNHCVRLQAELKSTGTTRKRINLSLLKTVNVEIPPIHEQRRIAEILDTIDPRAG
jgi:type I restriction enzyme S subunit